MQINNISEKIHVFIDVSLIFISTGFMYVCILCDFI